ncbi:MAG: CrcB family protein [Cyanobacteria bacterium]|nr:CrcB family protein [Cyanobacteriota bacterium]MDA1246403.1 CrcB family protein [Cyanobacteriota bacterium]
MRSRSLQGDLSDLVLVAGGAIPGALLRWQLEADVLANMLGCLLLGVVLAQPSQRKKLMLLAGIGFCGALTTFCTWMLDLARALLAGKSLESAMLLLASLAGGIALVAFGHAIGRFFAPLAPSAPSRPQQHQ